jgi:hypothetical protein
LRRTTLTAILAVVALSAIAAAAPTAIAAAAAIAAPMASKPPTIRGRPNFGQTLTCNKGTWSADAVSFSYAWAISGGSTIATGRTLKVPASATGYNLVCIVTAHDAHGHTTPASSSEVLIGDGISTVKITKASVRNGVVTISGIVGPAAARTKGPNGWSSVVLDRELTSKINVQRIAGPKVVKTRNGSFTISGRDTKGAHSYIITFDPSEGSDYAPGQATRKLTVR